MWTWMVAAAWAGPLCGTLHPDVLAQRVSAPVVAFGAPLPDDTTLWTERDAWDGWPNSRTSDHFVLKWGDAEVVRDDTVDGILDAMEAAWDVYIDALDHRPPTGGLPLRFNVYLAGTGRDRPREIGAAGYFTTDPDGYPMVVVEPNAWRAGGPYLDQVVAHELYHAVQWTTGAYGYAEGAGWFWEATATWASGEVYPSNLDVADFLPAYLMLQPYPVDFWVYPEQGLLEEYYAYGAYLFPTYVSGELGADLVRNAWEAPQADDPLDALAAELSNLDLPLSDVWLDHVAHNVHMDYPNGDELEAMTDDWALAWGPDQRLTGDIDAYDGAPEGVRPGKAHKPGRYGSNVWRIRRPVTDELTLRIEGNASGDLGSEASFGGRVVVHRDDGSLTYLDVPFDGLSGALTVPELDDRVKDVSIVVGAWTPDKRLSRWPDERFGYRLFVDVPEIVVPEPEPTTPVDDDVAACGCRSGPTPVGVAWFALLGLARRRRRS